ncbi:response regulator, partial [Vibrio cholerae HC-56A2]
MPPTCNS